MTTKNAKDAKDVKDVREQGLDKFYTLPSYSKHCINKVFELYDKSDFHLIIEPSAWPYYSSGFRKQINGRFYFFIFSLGNCYGK